VAEGEEPALGRQVAEDQRVVRILAAQDRGARRAAQRIRREKVFEHRAPILDQRFDLGHIAVDANVLVIGEDEHDVGELRRWLRLLGQSGIRKCQQHRCERANNGLRATGAIEAHRFPPLVERNETSAPVKNLPRPAFDPLLAPYCGRR
jgi:hypothetical protein